jgi:hypothetical protein
MANQAVSYFFGIQFKHEYYSGIIPYVQLESLTNNQTCEHLVCKKGRLLNWVCDGFLLKKLILKTAQYYLMFTSPISRNWC